MVVVLKPVSNENWYECTQLKVKPEQLNIFPAPVVYWIAESKYVDDFELRAIYSEEVLVGFLVFCANPDKDDNYWIPAIMIGHRPDNLIAGKLYESLGFIKTSEEVIDGEIVHLLQIN